MSAYLVQSNSEPTLTDIIGAADATNHAIPTTNELSQAFTKLVNSGVMKIENKSYKIRDEYLGRLEKAYKSKGGLFESANKGQRWLNDSNLEIHKSLKITITENDVTNAYKEYTSKISKKG